MNRDKSNSTPAGYIWITRRFGISTPRNWHESYVSAGYAQKIEYENRIAIEYFPKPYAPEHTLCGNLEFALKYDGLNLAILASLFKKDVEKELIKYIREKPTGKYARKIWFLYEFLTGRMLPLADLQIGSYVDLLDSGVYFTAEPGKKSRRHRINDNLPGNSAFCALVRKTDVLKRYEEAGLRRMFEAETGGYSPALMKRALGYLYAKETKTSFAIERAAPSAGRAEKFAAALARADSVDFLSKGRLVELQNIIADDNSGESDYRSVQNYIGESILPEYQKIHYICPKPEDVPELMDGLIAAHNRLMRCDLPAVIHASIISFGFVFIHPFEDGNGRIHRFLIHNILALRGFTPKGILFPISPAIIKRMDEYDTALESFSSVLLPHIEYALDGEGRMSVSGETAHFYRYIDFTEIAEALYRFIEYSIGTELKRELAFLAAYDGAKESAASAVSMPSGKLELLIKCLIQGKGKLPKSRARKSFSFLSEKEIGKLEKTIEPFIATLIENS